NGVAQAIGDLAKRGREWRLKRSPFVLRQSFLANVERYQLAFGNFDVGKARNRFRIIKTEVQLVIFDRETKPVPHEIDVALDGLRTDFQLVRKLAAIRVTTGFQSLVHAHHAFERRPRVKSHGAGGGEFD